MTTIQDLHEVWALQDGLHRQIRELTAQRDELLHLCQRARGFVASRRSIGDMTMLLEDIEAAIARCEKEPTK